MTYRMLSHHCRSALAGAAIALLLSATAGVAQNVPSVFAGADPSAMVAEGKMWIYPTGGDGLQAWSTADRRTWKQHPLLRLRDIRWTKADGAPVQSAVPAEGSTGASTT